MRYDLVLDDGIWEVRHNGAPIAYGRAFEVSGARVKSLNDNTLVVSGSNLDVSERGNHVYIESKNTGMGLSF